MKSLLKTYSSLLFILLIQTIISTAEDDIVKSIPEYDYKGRLYSGYLDVSDVKKFHYMFNLAHEDPENKPLVLWLNGGPGCSSLDGWANEHGPMQMDSNGTFNLNEYSWNRAANMIYLESPGNVGFSLINSTNDTDLYLDDNITADDNLIAMIFLKNIQNLIKMNFILLENLMQEYMFLF